MGSYKYCICFTRKFRWADAEPPADVKAAFAALAGDGSQMSPEQLHRFLVETQEDSAATTADAERIIEHIRQQRHRLQFGKVSRPVLALEEFHHYLFSAELNPPLQSQVHHDMTAPASHYFIYTGHNSYLTGNQLSSDCSDVPIIKALQRGVRVIELDMWPNSTKDNIDILHGSLISVDSKVEMTYSMWMCFCFGIKVKCWGLYWTQRKKVETILKEKEIKEHIIEDRGRVLRVGIPGTDMQCESPFLPFHLSSLH